MWEQEEATSEESDAQLVQSDEEDVQPDTSLIGLRDVCAAGGSEDSEAEASPPPTVNTDMGDQQRKTVVVASSL